MWFFGEGGTERERESRKSRKRERRRKKTHFFSLLLPSCSSNPKIQISGLLESVRSARYGKLRDGIGQLTGPMAVKLTNITASELNAVRPFFLGALTAFAAVTAPPGRNNNGGSGSAAEAAPAAAATAPPPPASQSQQQPSQQPSQQQSQRFRTRNRD